MPTAAGRESGGHCRPPGFHDGRQLVNVIGDEHDDADHALLGANELSF